MESGSLGSVRGVNKILYSDPRFRRFWFWCEWKYVELPVAPGMPPSSRSLPTSGSGAGGNNRKPQQPQLHQQLMQVTLESGIIGKSGLKVESMDVTKTAILLADGEAISTDVINAADSLHVSDAGSESRRPRCWWINYSIVGGQVSHPW